MTVSELKGMKPGPWCPAYRKHKNRQECNDKRCRYYQNHRVEGPIHHRAIEGSGVTSGLDPVSVETPKIGYGAKEFYKVFEECAWHCVRYDNPSKLVTLPWEEAE